MSKCVCTCRGISARKWLYVKFFKWYHKAQADLGYCVKASFSSNDCWEVFKSKWIEVWVKDESRGGIKGCENTLSQVSFRYSTQILMRSPILLNSLHSRLKQKKAQKSHTNSQTDSFLAGFSSVFQFFLHVSRSAL